MSDALQRSMAENWRAIEAERDRLLDALRRIRVALARADIDSLDTSRSLLFQYQCGWSDQQTNIEETALAIVKARRIIAGVETEGG
jgi:hypothetical protein